MTITSRYDIIQVVFSSSTNEKNTRKFHNNSSFWILFWFVAKVNLSFWMKIIISMRKNWKTWKESDLRKKNERYLLQKALLWNVIGSIFVDQNKTSSETVRKTSEKIEYKDFLQLTNSFHSYSVVITSFYCCSPADSFVFTLNCINRPTSWPISLYWICYYRFDDKFGEQAIEHAITNKR